MIRTFENIETISHKAIDLIGKAAIGVSKAVVTLFCLGGSLAYTTGVKLRKTFDNHSNEQTIKYENVAQENAVSEPNSEVSKNIADTQGQESEIQISKLVDLTQGIVTIIESINLVKPISHNIIENYITDSLKDVLESNLVDAVSYTLPRNKRVRKTHIRYKDLGILKQYHPLLIAKGVLN